MRRNEGGEHPVERSTYHPIQNYIEELGFSSVQELKKNDNFVDILFEADSSRFILEIKIRRKKESIDQIKQGIVQVYGYSQTFHTNNMLVIVLPPLVTDDIENFSELYDRVLKSRVESIILTDYWYSYETNLSIEEILSNLKSKIDKKLSAVMREGIASVLIQKTVQNLSRFLNKHFNDDKIIEETSRELTRDYGLFITLSSQGTSKIKNRKKKQRNQTVDLLAYILVNQILFYFLYSERTRNAKMQRSVPEMKKITHPTELESYFESIRSIDYGPIFDIKVTHRIPFAEEIVQEINYLIECLTPLQIDKLKHDLYGKLFANSIPKETRKTLASYYTKSSSADLLANLTIDNHNDTVWDLACGSGTLLMSSYDRKKELFEKEKRISTNDEFKKLHAKFLEEEITGTDIMPFACHLTGINLSAKGLEATTDFLRVSCMDVLSISDIEKDNVFVEANSQIKNVTDSLLRSQKIVEDFFIKPETVETTPKTFVQEKVDRVVINPPFTGVKRLPKTFREEFNKSPHSAISGNRNLWGHFMALADSVVKDGGKIGAIIPISLLHGQDTLKLRKYFLEHYSIEYIIKPIIGKSFSEDSQFTDIIFVAKKVKPERSQKVKFVCLKEDISNWSRVDINSLSKQLKTELEDSDKEYLSYFVKQEELRDNGENLMKYIFTNNAEFKNKAEDILSKLEVNEHLAHIKKSDICDGLALRIKGGVNNSVYTRTLGESRATKARLVFEPEWEDRDFLYYYDNKENKKGKIEKIKVFKTLRTLTGIRSVNIDESYDYLDSKFHRTERVAHVFIENRYWPRSNELHFISCFSEQAILPLNMFIMYKAGTEESKIMSLYFNSVFFILQLFMSSKQSTRGYLEIKQIDLPHLLVPEIRRIRSVASDKLLEYFEKHQKDDYGSLVYQFSEATPLRIQLDMQIADAIEFKITEKELRKLYDLIASHISSMP